MKDYFSIGEAAEMVDMTPETLRHYDRIGLVKPSFKDQWTSYRYYSPQEIIRLHTIRALRYMDMSLAEIKKILELDRLEDVVYSIKQAAKTDDEKIDRLRLAKEKIQLARRDYEKKLGIRRESEDIFTQHLPRRVILLSDTLQSPTLDNLWNYHSHFYAQLGASSRDQFQFEDLAGMYTHRETTRLFAVCRQYPSTQGLTVLPAGSYLCANCPEEKREQTAASLMEIAKRQTGAETPFLLQLIVISGILQWSYQIQVLLESDVS